MTISVAIGDLLWTGIATGVLTSIAQFLILCYVKAGACAVPWTLRTLALLVLPPAWALMQSAVRVDTLVFLHGWIAIVTIGTLLLWRRLEQIRLQRQARDQLAADIQARVRVATARPLDELEGYRWREDV